ncbi:MAG: LacI family transcriptional regulator [Hyphomicrobiales bacterium]|nr:LacI family transcriptional regulator [Hyphomicrobiales bacterium]
MTFAGSRRAPTLRDVADKAGVSMMTVSNVINARAGRVSKDTQTRILTVIDELGYRPQRSGRSLRMQREYAIGLTIVHPDRRFLDDPYLNEVAAGMSNALANAGYGLMINGVQDIDGLKKIVAHAAGVDALAVFASGDRESRHEIYRILERLHHPLAIIQDDMPELSDTCSVFQDDFAGARDLADSLLAAGAERIVFAAPTHTWPAVERREAGVRAAAHRRAKVTRIGCNETDFQAGIDQILSAFDRLGIPDAIVGANDQIGIAAIHAASRRGVAIPETLMVAGFNAFPFRQFSLPLISSVSSPAYAIGETVAESLLYRIDNNRFANPKQVLSVAPAPGATIRN